MVQYERYKGQNIICLLRKEDDRFPFSFGYGKAKLIVQHIDAIKEFVAKEEANAKNNTPDPS